MIEVLIIAFLFALDVYILIIEPYISSKKEMAQEEKVNNSYKEEAINECIYKYYEYPKRKLVEVDGSDEIRISDFDVVDIKNELSNKSIIFENIQKIQTLNLKNCDVTFIDSPYKYEDGMIFDLNDKLMFLTKEKSNEELIYIANNYNVSRSLIHIFSDANVVQFSPVLGAIRVTNTDECSLIVPKLVEGVRIEKVEINVSKMKYLYLSEYVFDICLETKCTYDSIVLNSNFKIRNKSVVYKKTNKYVAYYNNAFSSDSYLVNKQNIYKMKYVLSKKVKKCRIDFARSKIE